MDSKIPSDRAVKAAIEILARIPQHPDCYSQIEVARIIDEIAGVRQLERELAAANESHAYWKAQWNAQTAWLEIEKEKSEKLAAQVAKLREALARARDSRPSQKWQSDIIDAALADTPYTAAK